MVPESPGPSMDDLNLVSEIDKCLADDSLWTDDANVLGQQSMSDHLAALERSELVELRARNETEMMQILEQKIHALQRMARTRREQQSGLQAMHHLCHGLELLNRNIVEREMLQNRLEHLPDTTETNICVRPGLEKRLDKLVKLIVQRRNECSLEILDFNQDGSHLEQPEIDVGSGLPGHADEGRSAKSLYPIFEPSKHREDLKLSGCSPYALDPRKLTFVSSRATDAARALEASFEKAISAGNPRKKALSARRRGTRMPTVLSRLTRARRKGRALTDLKQRSVPKRALESNLERFITRNVQDQVYRVPESVAKATDALEEAQARFSQSPSDVKFRELESVRHALLMASLEIRISEEKWPIPLNERQMNPRVLLACACDQMCVRSGTNALRSFCASTASQRLYVYLFWYTHCRFFQKRSERQQRHILRWISSIYVHLLKRQGATGNFLWRYYPILLAKGVFLGFHYLCPGSRHLYTPQMQKELFVLVCRVLYGIDVGVTSVMLQRYEMFPEDAALDHVASKQTPKKSGAINHRDDEDGDDDDTSLSSKREAQKSGADDILGDHKEGVLTLSSEQESTSKEDTVGASVDAAQLRKLRRRPVRYSYPPGVLIPTGEVASEGSTTMSLPAVVDSQTAQSYTAWEAGEVPVPEEPITKFTGSRSSLSLEDARPAHLKCPKRRQERCRFNTARITPMLQEFLQLDSDNAVGRAEPIKYTQPMPWFLAGGLDTHRKIPVRDREILGIQKRRLRAVQRFKMAGLENVKNFREESKRVDSEARTTLRSRRNIGNFAVDIVEMYSKSATGSKMRGTDGKADGIHGSVDRFERTMSSRASPEPAVQYASMQDELAAIGGEDAVEHLVKQYELSSQSDDLKRKLSTMTLQSVNTGASDVYA